MKEQHPFDAELQEKVAQHKTSVSPSLWDKIEQELGEDKKTSYYPLVRWAVAAAFLIGFGILKYSPTIERDPIYMPTEEKGIQTPISLEKDDKQSEESMAVAVESKVEDVNQHRVELKRSESEKQESVKAVAQELKGFEITDEEEDERAFAEAELPKEVLNIGKSGYFSIEIGKAEDLIEKLEKPTTYGEELKIYAVRSMNQVFEGKGMEIPPAPKNSIDELKAKWNTLTTALPKGLFWAKPTQPK
jgi:hypothetical protein